MRLAVPNVFTKDGDDLGIGLGVEVVSTLDENKLEFLVYMISTRIALLTRCLQLVMIPSVSSALPPNTRNCILTVNQTEFGPGVADVRVTVEGAGNTVGSPSSVSHGSLAEENLLHVDPSDIAVLGR